MFELFERAFEVDPGRAAEAQGVLRFAHRMPAYGELLTRFGGMSFSKGLYRVIRKSDIELWNGRIRLAFPEYVRFAMCFGYDWLGRVFALDQRAMDAGASKILMFEPGTGEVLGVPSSIQSFHDEELLTDAEAVLSIPFYRRWIASGGPQPGYLQCIGYGKPLFLGGVDELENLALRDIDVYWHMAGQLIKKVKGLPVGTPVKVRFE